MRVSQYTIGAELPAQPFYVLVHGLTGAVDKVAKNLGSFLVANRGQEVEGLGDAFPNLDTVHLERRGYLTSKSTEEERKLLMEISATLHDADLRRTPPSFIFVPTYTCNLRCPYCFQSHEMHAGSGRYSALMTEEQVDAAFSIIRELGSAPLAPRVGLPLEGEVPPTPPLEKVGLFGGEPLTSHTLPIVEYIVRKAREHGVVVFAITNGVELDRFDHLLRPGMLQELQITLDGSAPLHDRRRVGPGFKKTFDTIARNIDLALERHVRVSLRMNVDTTNAADIESLQDFCAARGWTASHHFSAHAAAVTADGRHQRLIPRLDLVRRTTGLRIAKSAPMTSYEKVARELLAYCLDGSGQYPFQTVANCSAETGLMMFDPLNDVYACWEEIGETAKRTGTYDRFGIHFEANAKKWLSRFPGAIEDCSRCPYALIHTSGCAKHAEDQSGTIFASACESFQEYFPYTLAVAYDQFEAHLLGRAPLACAENLDNPLLADTRRHLPVAAH